MVHFSLVFKFFKWLSLDTLDQTEPLLIVIYSLLETTRLCKYFDIIIKNTSSLSCISSTLAGLNYHETLPACLQSFCMHKYNNEEDNAERKALHAKTYWMVLEKISNNGETHCLYQFWAFNFPSCITTEKTESTLVCNK